MFQGIFIFLPTQLYTNEKTSCTNIIKIFMYVFQEQKSFITKFNVVLLDF